MWALCSPAPICPRRCFDIHHRRLHLILCHRSHTPPPQTRNTDKRRSTAPFIKETRKDRCPARTWPRHRFTTSQVSPHNPLKWCLPGGRNYENILYVHFCNKQTECAAHSWVVHLHNPDVGVLFDDAGWDVIIPPCKEFGRCHPRDGSRSVLSAHPYLGFAHTIPRAAGNLGGGRFWSLVDMFLGSEGAGN